MLKRISDSESSALDESNNVPLPQDREPSSDNGGGDVETGFIRGGDPPERDDEHDERKVEEGAQEQYTHVSLPLPGHNFDCVDVLKKADDGDDEKKEQSSREERKKSKIRFFGGRGGKGGSALKEEKEKPSTKNDMQCENDESESSKRRSCPIHCAVCLMEYEITERVSWSSNPGCTHVFHEDCVVEWLVSLGRTKSKMKRFSEDPTEAQLLNYELECPCCRQEFISRGHAGVPSNDSGGAEESV